LKKATQQKVSTAVMRIKKAGKSIAILAREMETILSSIGHRITSDAKRLNPDSSSRKNTMQKEKTIPFCIPSSFKNLGFLNSLSLQR